MGALAKALSETEAGSKLRQELIDKEIQSLIRVDNPLRENLPRKQGSGDAWYVNRRSANPTAAFVADTDELTVENSSYEEIVAFPYKTIAAAGAVTRKLEAIGKSYVDIEAEELEAAVDAVRELEEEALINGDSSADVKQFDGLDVLLGEEYTQYPKADSGNGGALTLADLDEAIDACYGHPDMLICAYRTKREINALLQVNQRFVDKKQVEGGFELMSYGDVAIYPSTHVSVADTRGSASNATKLYLIDTKKVWVGVLTELTRKVLAETTSQYRRFDVFEDITLVVANPAYCRKIAGIIPPA